MKLKIWEISILTALVITVLCGFFLDDTQQELSDKLIRLHVLANSDSEEDQALKLHVRDAVLAEVDGILTGEETKEEAAARLRENLDRLTESAQAAIEAEGFDYTVSVSLTEERFPTRTYDSFALPAGDYTALRVEIGEAGGRNWWCVVFPPLCVSAAESGEAFEASALTNEEVALITEEDGEYAFKFRTLEILESVKSALGI